MACAFFGIATLAAGCNRQSEDATPDAVSRPPDQGSLGAPVAPAEVQRQTLEVPRDATPDAVLDELNRELRRWLIRNQRRPASFEEFVSTSQMQVPAAPPGKKYTLSKETRIVLVDQ